MLNRVRRIAIVLVVVLVSAVALAAAALIGLRFWIDQMYDSRIYSDAGDIPARPVAIVFGAGLSGSGHLSPVLAARVDAAFDLYQAGKVQKVLLTGDNRFIWYNEPGAMADHLEGRGVPQSDLILDYAGRRTYDSCYRAKHIFGVERTILVTQNYHMDRALFTCNGLGVEAIGLASNRTGANLFDWLRELPAVAMAWWDLYVRHPLPVLGEPLPIDWGS
jgi:SanA protein